MHAPPAPGKYEQIHELTPTFLYSYADKTQSPLSTYGAENIAFMKNVAAKYDPKGVFQTHQPGGFKLANVSSTS